MRTQFLHQAALLAALAVLPIGTAAAFPVIIDFDTLPGGGSPAPGTVISTQYSSLGVTFSSPTAPAGGATIFANGEASSGSNALTGLEPGQGGLHTIYMVFTSTLASSVDVTLISVGCGTTYAVAYAADRFTVLDSVSITHGPSSGNGFGNHDPITLTMGSGSGIGMVAFWITQNGPVTDGYGIDDIGFTLVPAPGAAALLGLGGLAASRRRR